MQRRDDRLFVNKTSPLRLGERDEGDAVVLSAEGFMDMAAAPVLTEQIRAILRRRPPALIVDLIDVTFLATAGMSVLMEAYRKCEELAIAFRVVARGPITAKPMELLGIDDLLDIHPTVHSALRAVPPSSAATS